MWEWAQENQTLLWWLGIGSAITFVGSLLAVPWLAAKIPADYFNRHRRPPSKLAVQHPALRLTLAILRNLLGVLILLAGIAMLFLPGQGLLTILFGLMLINFPGKYRLEQWAIRQPAIFKAINWMRAKARREPLERPDRQGGKLQITND